MQKLKNIFLFTLLVILFPVLIWGKIYEIDKSHTNVSFKVSHLGLSSVSGVFSNVNGVINWDDNDPKSSSLVGRIEVNSINTHNEDRDLHLKGNDFFKADKFPHITFKSVQIKGKKRRLKITGDLTILGVTKEVKAVGVVNGPVKGFKGEDRISIQTKFTIDRRDFGLSWNRTLADRLAIGNKVTIEIDLEASASE